MGELCTELNKIYNNKKTKNQNITEIIKQKEEEHSRFYNHHSEIKQYQTN